MTIIEAIKIRKSCRTYSNRAIEQDTLAELRQFLTSNTKTPFESNVRFHLIDFNEMEIGELKNLTTYGVIKGARQFIVGAVEKQPKAMEDYGYCMERNILKATSMGLGACWLGGTFKRSGFAGKINLGENELLPVISPVGYSSDKRSIVDRMFRFVAASDKRKPWNELFYLHDIETPLDKGNSDSFDSPLECVRIAPSASNKQPWRIIKGRDKDAFHFYLKRTSGYENIIKDIKLQNVDMGIAMCHFELSTVELGLKGYWRVTDPKIKSDGMEYIVSWVAHDQA
ncbi:MAG: nitroreductase family protein [Proteobacteria bacterium]|nr:nitroreductase family protein [Pseudomonadota bacterium]